MTKRFLLEMIDKSILKEDVSIQGLYKKYYPILKEVLRPYKDKTRLNFSISDDILKSKNAFDNFVRTHTYNEIEIAFQILIKEVRVMIFEVSDLQLVPDGAVQLKMRTEIIGRIDSLNVLFKEHSEEANYDILFNLLMKARNALDEMIFPRGDKRVICYYFEIMETIDELLWRLQTGSGEITSLCERINNVTNEWKMLNRG